MLALLTAVRTRLMCVSGHRSSWQTVSCRCGDLHVRPCCYRRVDRPASARARRAHALQNQPTFVPALVPTQPEARPCPTHAALRIAA